MANKNDGVQPTWYIKGTTDLKTTPKKILSNSQPINKVKQGPSIYELTTP